MSHYGGDVALITVTAPGSERLPDRDAMRRWNRHAPDHWRSLHRGARQATLRACGTAPRLLAWTWEFQRRGALHKHVIVGVDSARELHAAHVYVAELARLRQLHDFGFVDRGRAHGGRRSLEVIPAERAARYAAKYLSPLSEDGKPTLSETVTSHDVPPLVVYVAAVLTLQTGITMRYLRLVRYAWALGIDLGTGEVTPREGVTRDQVAELLQRLDDF